MKSAMFFALFMVAAFIVDASGYRLVALPAVLLAIYFYSIQKGWLKLLQSKSLNNSLNQIGAKNAPPG